MAETILVPRMLDAYHQFLEERVKPGAIAIDGTAGNGYDTVFLANLVSETGHVWAFDIQKAAIDATKSRVQAAGFEKRVTLCLQSHSEMISVIPSHLAGSVSGIVFNLGYLPGSDKKVTTLVPTSLEAIRQSLLLLSPDGILTVAIYPGHQEGTMEGNALIDQIPTLEAGGWLIRIFKVPEPKSPAPYLITYERKKNEKR